jgi:hypothetical protein
MCNCVIIITIIIIILLLLLLLLTATVASILIYCVKLKDILIRNPVIHYCRWVTYTLKQQNNALHCKSRQLPKKYYRKITMRERIMSEKYYKCHQASYTIKRTNVGFKLLQTAKRKSNLSTYL